MREQSPTTRAATWNRHAYKFLATAAFGLMAVGTVAYHILEDWSWVDSVYFATVAVTTVGFGDLVPTSNGAKLFTVLYVLIGMTIITTYLHTRFNRMQSRRASKPE
jgi:hypothetical protein